MTDIVERLRQGIADRGAERLMDEAADEIERLRAEIERLRTSYLHVVMLRDEAADEIERLQALIDPLKLDTLR